VRELQCADDIGKERDLAQRRVLLGKVVDGDGDAEFVEPSQYCDILFLDDLAFNDLKLDVPGVDRCRVDDRFEVAMKRAFSCCGETLIETTISGFSRTKSQMREHDSKSTHRPSS
jgi:hypothetical protein